MENLQIVPASKHVEPQYVEMMVPLYSYGCEKKVKKALSNLRGIYSVSVEYKEQKVTVWGICNKYDVLATMRKKRRDARFWNAREDCNGSTTPNPIKLPRSLTMPRSLSWRAWKSVFNRSHSFN